MDVVLFMGLSADNDGWTRHAVGDIFIRDFSCSFSPSMKKRLCFGFGSRQQWISLVWRFNQIVAKLFRRMHVLTVAVQLETPFLLFCGYHLLM